MGWLTRVLLTEAADVTERALAERDEALRQLATTRHEVASILGPALAAASPGTPEWSAVRDALAAVRPEREPQHRATAASEMPTAMPGNTPASLILDHRDGCAKVHIPTERLARGLGP